MSNYECKYPHLFSPIILGHTAFRNRIFASPTGYANNNGDGYLNEGAVAYYERKAKGGAASVATLETIVDGEFGKGGPKHICLDTPNVNTSLARVANSIRFYGAVPSLELTHAGMYGNRNLPMFSIGDVINKPSYGPVDCEVSGKAIFAMTEEIIERTIRKFAAGAALGKRCGYGMVTLHAGHGWLLHQFLSPKINTRTDRWGGAAVENRARLVVEICDAIKREVGAGFPIEIRISGSDCYEGGYGIDEGIAIAKQLDGHVDLIHVSAGNHEVPEAFPITHPSMFLEEGALVEFAAAIKKEVKTPVAAIGGLSDPAMMEEIIASGKADVVEAARELIADPDFPLKVRTGNERNARKCIRCFSCFSNGFLTGEHYCSINPESGHEWELRNDFPISVKKKVLVIGGGPGGMQAALTCAQRGHDVILCEQSDRLGGVLRCEEEVYFKKNLDYYLNQQADTINRAGIDVRLNTKVTPEYAADQQADVIIAALGAEALKPKIAGIDGKQVLSAQQAYTSVDRLGDAVVILGGGLVGVELGLHLIHEGKQVKIVEMTDHINDGGNFIHMMGLKVEMKKRGLDVMFRTKAIEINADGVVCEGVDGEVTLPADSVVYAVGQVPLQKEALAYHACAPEFYLIGDCVALRNITSATGEAFMTARNIGRCL